MPAASHGSGCSCAKVYIDWTRGIRHWRLPARKGLLLNF